jgi:hypothetical protein
LKDSPALLELAIWKSKISEQYDTNNVHLIANKERKRPHDSDSRTQSRTDSLTTVIIIVPLVFAFLTDGGEGNDIVGEYDDNDGDGYDYNDIDDCDESGDNSGDYLWRSYPKQQEMKDGYVLMSKMEMSSNMISSISARL